MTILQLAQTILVCLGIAAPFMTLAAWWIRGIPERQRAANETMVVEDGVTMRLFDRLEKEVNELKDRIKILEEERENRDERIATLMAENVRLVAADTVHNALVSVKDAEIARLQLLVPTTEKLVEATERNAAANERLADATEHLHDGEKAK